MFKELKLKMSQHKNAVALINSDRKFSYFTLLDRIEEKEREYCGFGIQNGKIAAIIGDYSLDGIVCLHLNHGQRRVRLIRQTVLLSHVDINGLIRRKH